VTDIATIPARTLTRGQVRLLAFTAGATVANLYYAQPLLPTIATDLHVSQTSAALLVTLTQLSYGVGLLLVPAADITDLPPEIEDSYRSQLRETRNVARTQPVLRWRSLIGACGFGSFAAFWTTVSFLLASPRYGFNQLEIGLFALAGAARRHERGKEHI
jgi:MFS family permease